MKKTIKIYKTCNALQFYNNETNQYEIPFQVLDENYGRIEVHIELLGEVKQDGKDKYYEIANILLYFTQTKDKKLKKKIFKIPCNALNLISKWNKDNYFKYVWNTMYCDIHKTIAYSAYPENHHNKLIIDTSLSSCAYIYFE